MGPIWGCHQTMQMDGELVGFSLFLMSIVWGPVQFDDPLKSATRLGKSAGFRSLMFFHSPFIALVCPKTDQTNIHFQWLLGANIEIENSHIFKDLPFSRHTPEN